MSHEAKKPPQTIHHVDLTAQEAREGSLALPTSREIAPVRGWPELAGNLFGSQGKVKP